jgi:Flp pilus assembly protein TadD
MPRIMPKRKKKRTTTPDKVTHRLIDSGFARLREHRFAEAEGVFQRALTLEQGTNEMDGEDIARIEHLTGVCLRERRQIGAARLHFARALAQAEGFYGANHVALMPICVDLGDAMCA